MLAAGAAERQRQAALSLLDVPGQSKFQQRVKAIEKDMRLFALEDEISDLRNPAPSSLAADGRKTGWEETERRK